MHKDIILFWNKTFVTIFSADLDCTFFLFNKNYYICECKSHAENTYRDAWCGSYKFYYVAFITHVLTFRNFATFLIR